MNNLWMVMVVLLAGTLLTLGLMFVILKLIFPNRPGAWESNRVDVIVKASKRLMEKNRASRRGKIKMSNG